MSTQLEAIVDLVPSEEPVRNARILDGAMRLIEAIAASLVAALVVFLFANVIFRYVLNAPLFWIDELNSIIFLWLGMLGAVIAMHRSEHMRLTLFVDMLPAKARSAARTLALTIVAAFLLALLRPAIQHLVNDAIIEMPTLEISSGYRLAAIVAGVALMLVVTLSQIWRNASSLMEVAGTVVLVAAVAGILHLAHPYFQAIGGGSLFLLAAIIAVCLVLSVPIAFCFGVATLSFLVFTTGLPLSVMVGRMDEGMSGLILLSVPVFIMLGGILDATGMGKAIVDFLASVLGHVRAGMSYVLLGSLYLVSGISGSKVSDMATVAPALFPEMKRRGNKPSEMVALLATGAIMADTVPPSIVLIVLGSVAGLSIAQLFTSGFVIAFVLLFTLAAVARWKSAKENLEGVRRPTLRLIWKSMLIAAPALFLPFLIRVAVGEGIATATEVSTIAIFYAVIVGILLYGGFSLSRFYTILVETAAMSGAVLLIMGTALAAAWALTQTGFAQTLTQWMVGLPGGWVAFMGVSIVTFIVLGCLLEGLPALVLLGPLMFPIAHSLGINGIHYAMVVVVAMNIGLFIPPIGVGFYLACSIGKVRPNEALGTIWTYLLALIVGLIAIALIPAISTGYL